MEDNHLDIFEEYDKEVMLDIEIKKELDRYNEECGGVITYTRDFCTLPNYGDWRDGKYSLRVWSSEVRKRDGHTCRREGCGSKKNLHAHHIYNQADNPDIRFEVWNGVTLCQTCHIAFHKIYGNVENNEEQIKEFLSIRRQYV